MFIVEVIIMLVLVFIVAVIINGIEDYHNKNSLIKLSFVYNVGGLKLPIVTFVNNGQPFNFIIDTGATLSIIDSNILNKLAYVKTDTVGNAYGFTGEVIPTEYANIEISYEDFKFEDEFQIIRMEAFDNIKEVHDIEIAGILGSTFLKRYDFTIDYTDLTIFTKKDRLE